MPVKPEFTWEQTEEEVLLHVTIKGFKKESVDVFITDAFVKVNAAPTYLLLLDLLHPINVETSSYHADKVDQGCLIHIKLRKTEIRVVWDALCINKDIGKSVILTRRAAAIERAEAAYNTRLVSRSTQREAEQRRLTEEQWEVEKQQRALIERRMKEEKSLAEADLFAWEESHKKKKSSAHLNNNGTNEDQSNKSELADKRKMKATTTTTTRKYVQKEDANICKVPYSPADIAAVHSDLSSSKSSSSSHIDTKIEQNTREFLLTNPSEQKQMQPIINSATVIKAKDNKSENDCVEETKTINGGSSNNNATQLETPSVRGANTVCVAIDFTPKLLTMPSRSRGDEEYYRKSKYKPVSIEDSPMFWKERGDAHYKAHNWKDAANAYSESIKRDGVFLTCVMNRAACYLQMMELKRAVEDCTLALTLLGNTPASEITQDRYRYLMAKLHARRGAAYGWREEYTNALTDLRVALAYTNAESEADEYAKLTQDINNITHKMKEKGLSDASVTVSDPFAQIMQTASGLYYQGKFNEALMEYEKILSEEPYHVNARSNYIATLLHCGRFSEALAECNKQITLCGEVASALNEPGGLSNNDITDSDDEDDDEQEEEQQLHDIDEKHNNDNSESESHIAHNNNNKYEKMTWNDRAKENADKSSLLQEICSITHSGHEQENQEEEEEEENEHHMRNVNNVDDAVRRRKAAAKLISERSTHVYVLLKAYVRAAAASCGLNDFRQAHVYLQNALRITPYDNDLLDDCNRIAEKIRMDTLVAASTAKV